MGWGYKIQAFLCCTHVFLNTHRLWIDFGFDTWLLGEMQLRLRAFVISCNISSRLHVRGIIKAGRCECSDASGESWKCSDPRVGCGTIPDAASLWDGDSRTQGQVPHRCVHFDIRIKPFVHPLLAVAAKDRVVCMDRSNYLRTAPVCQRKDDSKHKVLRIRWIPASSAPNVNQCAHRCMLWVASALYDSR